MGAPRICVAGIEPSSGRHIRPVTVRDAAGSVLTQEPVPLAYRANDSQRPMGILYLPTRDLNLYLVGTVGQGDKMIRSGEVAVEVYRGRVNLPTARAMLTQNQPQTVGDLQLTFERELPFTGLRIVKDPGSQLIWIASTMLVGGILLAFYFPHRRLWTRLRLEPTGVGVALAGAGKDMAKEVQRLAERLQALGGEIQAPEPIAAKRPAAGGPAQSGKKRPIVAAAAARGGSHGR
jgi:hypothetical protein